MSNALFPHGRKNFCMGNIAWKAAGGATVRAMLVKNTYTYDNTDEFFSDISSTYRVGNSAGVNRTDMPSIASLVDPADGICDGADAVFTTVTAGNTCNAVVLFADSGVDGTSMLIAYIDTGTGLPVTTNGGDITVQWDNTTNKIFKI
jgi:hypothetical protein